MKSKLYIPFVLGGLIFLLVIGPSPLDFRNIGWLSKGDMLFNYLGWETYRYGPWTNPIGLNPHYGLEFSSSIVFSDSIPILAIFFKIFSNWIGEPFQYFGLWLIICFICQAYFGYKVASFLTKNELLKIFISTFFLFLPVLLFRSNVHLALTGHFVILWALYLNFKKNINIAAWAFLFFIVLGIHFYLFVMVFAIWLGGILDAKTSKAENTTSLLYGALIVGLVIFLSAWQYGYFAISLGESAAIGYGGERVNLLSFINPLGWSLFIRHNLFEPPTIEGFSYMGAGVICAILFALLVLFRAQIRKEFIEHIKHHKFLLLLILVLSIISITHYVDIGNSHYVFSLNDRLYNILSAVRSSGRLIWPLHCLVIIASFWLIIHGYQRRCLIIIGGICLLQIIDTSRGWYKIHEQLFILRGSQINHPLKNEFWSEVPKRYKAIKIISPYWGNWNTVGVYAAENRLATNTVYLARVDKHKLEQSIEKTNNLIASGQFEPQTLYLFQKWSSDPNLVVPKFNSDRDLYAKIDGINVLAPDYKLCQECKRVPSNMEFKSIIPNLDPGELVQFSSNGNGGEFLIDGWGHSESWGTWSIGNSSVIAVPMGKHDPSRLQLDFRVLLGPKQPFSDIKISIEGHYLQEVRISNPMNNRLVLMIPRQFRSSKFIRIKFEYLNPTSPKNAGYGNDDGRILTLGIESLRLLR